MQNNIGNLFTRLADGTLCVAMVGEWLAGNLPLSLQTVDAEFAAAPAPRLVFETGSLGRWDSGLLTFLIKLKDLCD